MTKKLIYVKKKYLIKTLTQNIFIFSFIEVLYILFFYKSIQINNISHLLKI